MIGPKQVAPTHAEESAAYELATLRDGELCQHCRRDCGPTARDHRKNRSQGGQTVAENLQVLGLLCHTWKTDHPEDANAQGWGVPAWADPATYPARRWIRTIYGTHRLGWVLYKRDGGMKEITEVEAQRRIDEGLLYEEAAA